MATSNTQAVVTLLTSDTYLPGVLTLLYSLRDYDSLTGTDTVCLVTASTVSNGVLRLLQQEFDTVLAVEPIQTQEANRPELSALGRPDLTSALTKLHAWRLTQYSKVLFLDADTLVVQPILERLFSLDAAFAAAPDAGWPDLFNSGVMLLTPSQATFDALASTSHSFDGADQGLLNEHFGDTWHRLSFTYNVTPSAYYTYAPAYERYKKDIRVVHFIGAQKPWSAGSSGNASYSQLVDLWHATYDKHVGKGTPTTNLVGRLLRPTQTTGAGWDAAKEAPPNSGQITSDPFGQHLVNAWDDPARFFTTFEVPDSYPAIPAEIEHQYAGVTQRAAAPAVFPWDGTASAADGGRGRGSDTRGRSAASSIDGRTDASNAAWGNTGQHGGSYGGQDPRGLASSPDAYTAAIRTAQTYNTHPQDNESAPPGPTSVPPGERPAFGPDYTFTNAWDAIPGIGLYARQLSHQHEQSPSRVREPSRNTSHDDSETRTEAGSLTEETSLTSLDSNYLSGQDGDDEDVEVIPIPRPAKPRRRRRRSISGSPAPGLRHESSSESLKQGLPAHSSVHAPLHPLPSSGHPLPTRLSPSMSPPTTTIDPASIKNSTAARLMSHPTVPATRVFTPETDTALVKQQGMKALRRFVKDMQVEKEAGKMSGEAP